MNRPWTVYILRCSDGTLYTGISNDLERRLSAHQRGTGARYTRGRRPVRVALSEPAGDRGAALRREAEIRRMTRERKVELIESR